MVLNFQYLTPTADFLSIVAVGGYGRNNLAPGSDIDLLILTPYKITPRIEKIFETLLYILWDLKIKVGYSVEVWKILFLRRKLIILFVHLYLMLD